MRLPSPAVLATLLLLVGTALAQGGADGGIVRDLTPRDFPRMGAHPLGMGGAWTAAGSDEQSLFHNPACLALEKLPRFGTSHSARHFPGPNERDQLDCDPTALIFPVGPFLTVGHGWVTQGELGYDHRDLPDPSFPKQHLWGRERTDGLAFDAAILKVGGSRREQRYLYAAAGPGASPPDAEAAPDLTVEGEGNTVGVLATVFPGVRYGYVMEKLDQDFRVPNERRRYGVTRKLTSEGWALSPTGWLTLTWQTDHPTYKTSGLEGAGKGPGATIRRFGCEVKLAPLGAVRLGSINGERTWGATLNLWRNRIHWVQADGQMPEIVQGQWPAGQYEAVHAYGWSLGL